ncbi:MAG: hypothetical protein ACYSR5_08065 [Planctomycetota bacterium]
MNDQCSNSTCTIHKLLPQWHQDTKNFSLREKDRRDFGGKVRTAIPIIIALIFFASCGTTGRQAREGPKAKTTVEVENRNYLDMNIYVLHGGQRIRLGRATGLANTIFVIPDYVLFGGATLRFVADPIGGRQLPTSHEVTVLPGDQVEMIIP